MYQALNKQNVELPAICISIKNPSMTHRFPVKEIALQAGLSTATVDRVLHSRTNVSLQSVRRVQNAIADLHLQEKQLSARGKKLFIDFVVEAPDRFSSEIRRAVESEIGRSNPVVIRPRFIMQEHMQEAEAVSYLKRIMTHGSNGVCLKLRDTPKLRDMIKALSERNIPVLTMFTDIPISERLTYVGIDNAKAGKTAAYLISKTLHSAGGTILMSRSHEHFKGEETRALSFRSWLTRNRPDLKFVETTGGSGVDHKIEKDLASILEKEPNICAVYSMGGGNRAIIQMLEQYKMYPDSYIAHDLNQENKALLNAGRISFVLHDEITQDISASFFHISRANNIALTEPSTPNGSEVHIIAPEL
ncbi:LacI family transcriptional regulator [Pseudovibrio ascidiaceicola]|uniref:LacI family transcriptional regulator n=2 Tax=Pseudovibrio ascidiaceicola TaxID=285279 RepID=A0A1I4FRR8_9HYPH|nr:LacI family transcriptional regulator [Pseudovibrio ascidiaceicola]